ncbi:ABC transporter permease [Agrococcus baldri]|uniref:Autoinducer 2 import system permease protein LsrD n=1 Tax=Agrococcus baldri TaxID=153730 RepID=A0AA87US17_9MICO|nr:ABC transporter permease [Agrococcus baldri]GEK80551.1 monosaccharide-transporting ATPase [Agrococcus baldri]
MTALAQRSPWQRFLSALATPGGAVFILLVVLLIIASVANPRFAEPDQLVRFLARTAPIAIAAIGQFFVIVSGEFDLSMGAVIATQVVIAGNIIGQDEAMILPGIALMLLVGVVVGLVNGLLTTLAKVPSFIVTLGTMLALYGFVRFLTGGAATGNPVDSFREIGRGSLGEVLPYPVIILVVLALAAWLLMRAPFGHTLLAVGDNPVAARLSGTRTSLVKVSAFVLSSLAATVAGILLVGYAGVHPSIGTGYEFQAITAVVLGGAVLGGGRGWVLSAAAGAIALELLFTVLNQVGIDSTWRPSVQGIIIILAVALGAVAWRTARRPASVSRSDAAAGADPDPIPTPTPTPGEQ